MCIYRTLVIFLIPFCITIYLGKISIIDAKEGERISEWSWGKILLNGCYLMIFGKVKKG